ncbi:hypothetical protein [Nonomuraea sp. NPDC050310]|uniref:hypothetical protein n=1 Tax=Nonomuraea sp. NPDC050310 TaxID=3154935 RepID=UPI0033EC6C83
MTKASPHLSLEELLAHADGTAEPADPHLDRCPACRAELDAWRAVAPAVRDSAPAAQPHPRVLRGVLDAIDGPRRVRRRGPAVLSWVAAAAALVAIAGYVLLPRTASAPVEEAFDAQRVAAMGLLATECESLQVAAGSLRVVDGSRLVVRTAGGKDIRVDVAPTAKVTRQIAGTVADLVPGMSVLVRGEGSRAGDTLAAGSVLVAPAKLKPPRLPGGMGLGITAMLAGHGIAMGTVSQIRDGAFTVTGADGGKVKVTTSASTTLVRQSAARLTDLTTGKYTTVVGTLQGDGTLQARTVQQDTLTDGDKPSRPEGLKPPGGLPKPPGMKDPFSGLGCDADAIAGTALNGTPI